MRLYSEDDGCAEVELVLTSVFLGHWVSTLESCFTIHGFFWRTGCESKAGGLVVLSESCSC